MDSYRSLVANDITMLARICDPCFGNDQIRDRNLLRPYVALPDMPASHNYVDKDQEVALLLHSNQYNL